MNEVRPFINLSIIKEENLHYLSIYRLARQIKVLILELAVSVNLVRIVCNIL